MGRPTYEDMVKEAELEKKKEAMPIAKLSDLIHPDMIDVNGPPHPLKIIFDSDKVPTLKAFGFARIPGTMRFSSIIVTFKGDKVLKIEVDEPNLREIAAVEAKMKFQREIIDQGVEW